VSSRRQSSVFVFDLEKKQLVWVWGRDELDGPHDATVLDSGNFMIFDNGWHRGKSRVVEVNPVTRKIVWEFRGKDGMEFFSKSRGSAQRLANGHTLIGNSNSGQALEVDVKGQPLWEFNNPAVNKKGHRGAIIRMRRYEPALIEQFLVEKK
jgi:outer membrane protein assembly factor BamB